MVTSSRKISNHGTVFKAQHHPYISGRFSVNHDWFLKIFETIKLILPFIFLLTVRYTSKRFIDTDGICWAHVDRSRLFNRSVFSVYNQNNVVYEVSSFRDYLPWEDSFDQVFAVFGYISGIFIKSKIQRQAFLYCWLKQQKSSEYIWRSNWAFLKQFMNPVASHLVNRYSEELQGMDSFCKMQAGQGKEVISKDKRKVHWRKGKV